MLYRITDIIEEISGEALNCQDIIVGYITLEELNKVYKIFGFSIDQIRACNEGAVLYRNYMELFEDYSFGIVNRINGKDIYGPRNQMSFFITRRQFLVIGLNKEDHWAEQAFQKAMGHYKPESITFEKMIYSFFVQIISFDSIALEGYEYKINLLEDEIVGGMVHQNFNHDLMDMKKQLLILRVYYEQLLSMAEQLKGDENGLFLEQQLRYMRSFYEQVKRLSGNCQVLRENLVQLREAHDAYLNYNLNQIMKVFTVVTTIFMPLTLIVGWYGMNFTTMPEITWRYGYVFVVVLSLVVILICIIFFKKKRLI